MYSTLFHYLTLERIVLFYHDDDEYEDHNFPSYITYS